VGRMVSAFLRNVYWRIEHEGMENIPETGRAIFHFESSRLYATRRRDASVADFHASQPRAAIPDYSVFAADAVHVQFSDESWAAWSPVRKMPLGCSSRKA